MEGGGSCYDGGEAGGLRTHIVCPPPQKKDLLGPPPTHNQAARAANIAFALLSFRELLEGGGLWGGLNDLYGGWGGLWGGHMGAGGRI